MSLIHRLFDHGNYREGVCMKKIKSIYIDKEIREKATEAQEGGLYFEGLCLGESAGFGITDLKRKPNGSKTATQERLDMQHLNFKVGCINNFINIQPLINTQVKVWKKFTDYIYVTGVLDIFPTTILYLEEILPMVLIDLKTTKDLDNTFGNYAWGRFEDMDHSQLSMYSFLLRDLDIELNRKMGSKLATNNLYRKEWNDLYQNVPTFYWVFESGPKMRNQLFKVNQDNGRINEVMELIRKTSGLIDDEYSRPDGWSAQPSYNECRYCPLNPLNGGLCKEVNLIKEV